MDETKNTNEQDPVFSQLEGELKTRFELLPTELQEVITSSDYQMKLFEIAKKHKLTYDKLGQIELETTMVLLGMTPPDEFKLDLKEQLALDDTKINEIVLELNEKIFTPIREQLMGIYSQEEVEIGEKFAQNMTVEEKSTPVVAAAPSPYREAITTTPALNNTKIDESTIQINTTNSDTPLVTKLDPYRELPDLPQAGSGVAEPVEIKKETKTGIDAAFLKNIGALSLDGKQSKIDKEETPLDRVKDLGALNTMKNVGEIKKEISSVADKTAVSSIKSLKESLGADLHSLTFEKTDIPKETESVVDIPKKPLSSSESFIERTNTLDMLLKPKTENTSDTPSTTPKESTLQKIDSLINLKKINSFMATNQKEIPKSDMLAAFKQDTEPTSENQINEKEISSLAGEVKKTGFFAKMKNFFGGSKIKEIETPLQTENKPLDIPIKSIDLDIKKIPVSLEAKAPIDDQLLNDVKLLD